MKQKLIITVLFILASSTLDASASSVWECHGDPVRWDSTTVTMRPNPISFPAGSWRISVDSAIDRVNENPSRFQFANVTDGDDSRFRNNQNEIWGTGDVGVLGGAPAATFHRRLCAPIIIPFPPFLVGWANSVDEEDIVFDYNGGTDWEPGSSSLVTDLIRYGGDERQLMATAIHELGHAACLDHENDEYNMMGTDFEHLHVNNWFARGYLGEDAADGLVYLYGLPDTSTPFEDLGVVHWAYHGPDGEYSDHRRVRLYDTAGAVLPSTLFDYDSDGDVDERRYRVSSDQRVRVEFTYENNGTTRQNPVLVGFYWSDEAFIATADRRIGGASLDLDRNDVYTATHIVRIPTGIVPGQLYWIGAVIDERDDLNEDVEWNNATYIPVVAD